MSEQALHTQSAESFRELQARVEAEDPELHERASAAAELAVKSLNPLEGAGITQEELDKYRQNPAKIDERIAANDRIIGEDSQFGKTDPLTNAGIGSFGQQAAKRNKVLGYVKSRLENERNKAEAVRGTPLGGIVDDIMTGDRFGGNVKHFRDGGRTLILSSAQNSGPGVQVSMMSLPDGSSRMSFREPDGSSREYFSEEGVPYKLDHNGKRHLSLSDLAAHPEKAPVNPDELTGLHQRLQEPDLRVEDGWSSMRTPGQV